MGNINLEQATEEIALKSGDAINLIADNTREYPWKLEGKFMSKQGDIAYFIFDDKKSDIFYRLAFSLSDLEITENNIEIRPSCWFGCDEITRDHPDYTNLSEFRA